MQKFSITLTDVHEQDGEIMKSSSTLFGTLDHRGTSYTITYTEEDGDFANCTTTLQVDIPQKLVVITRAGGPLTSVLTMEEGVRHNCQYDTPYGTFLMGIHATEVTSNMCALGGALTLNYDIDINGSLVSTNHLHLSLKEIY